MHVLTVHSCSPYLQGAIRNCKHVISAIIIVEIIKNLKAIKYLKKEISSKNNYVFIDISIPNLLLAVSLQDRLLSELTTTDLNKGW